MSEDIILSNGNKEEQYQTLIPQIEAIVSEEKDLVANLANISACLKQQFGWWWIGFYLVKYDELVLGPFQGPVACTRIKNGRGVCGTAWKKSETIVVEDVEKFPGHIACSSLSKSEIVVPIILNNQVVAVLDADSEHLKHFDQVDRKYLEMLVDKIKIVFCLKQKTRHL